MAEIAILFVMDKIGIALAEETLRFANPLLLKKSRSIRELPDDMKFIMNELELIKEFLKKINMTDEVLETWIGQVRRLAYDMEDIVDQFLYVVGTHNKKGSWWDYIKKTVKKPQYLFSLEAIADKTKRIIQELKQLSESRDRWTKPLVSGIYIPSTVYETEQELYLPRHDYSIKDEELVGTDKNRQTLISSLHFNDQSRRTITVWGMGGIGKSTLVNYVYKNEASNFDCHAWVSVSQKYMEDIWRNMMSDLLQKDRKEFDAVSIGKLIEELKHFLHKKRYLIVLDDVWTAEVVSRLINGGVLVDNGLGSRVIITTRIEEVASVAGDDGCRIKVEPLDDCAAWILFCRKAFPNENNICPPDLQQCGKDIVEKCDGLPLALVAVGSILSLKRRSVKEWKLFYNQLIWELHSNENLNHVVKILNLSYKYLPNYLKNCFLYCAMFPEDYLIRRKKLTWMWIAEGFIQSQGANNLEDVADQYVDKLVQRSMLEVASRNSFARIKCLRMHDLVRELAIFQSRKESFSTNYSQNHGAKKDVDSRRVSVLQCYNGIQPSNICSARLRAFITFDTSMALSSWYSSILSKLMYLVVLDLSDSPIKNVPDSVGELFNLKFLCLNNTNMEELPTCITKLQNLQTLSLECTQFSKFPQGLSKLKKLRHLLFFKLIDLTYRSFNNWESMEPFEGLWNLKELQSLNEIRATEVFIENLGNLSQLRVFSISDVKSSHCVQLCNSLSRMDHLARLEIRASNEDELLHLDNLTFPNSLEVLDLYGRFSEGTFESPFFLNHGDALHLISLKYCQLTDNQLSRLSKLSKLTYLDLTRAYTGKQLHFSSGWFQNLKNFLLKDLPHVNEICFHEGALVRLEYLYIDNLPKLRDAPIGVEFLTCLKEAYCIDMHAIFSSNFWKAKLDHIPNVYSTTEDPL